MKKFVLAALLFVFSFSLTAQQKTLAERLGYLRTDRLLIVHTDDLGMSQSVNAASIKALESGLVNSAAIMVPTPWFPQIAAWAKAHPEADLGLHLTLTSEWTPYRWGPVLPKDHVASMMDETGYLYITEDVAAARIKPHEAEAEIRAQIERARAFGIQFTHLDSHMRTLLQTPALLEVLLRVARDYKLPVGLWQELKAQPQFAPLFNENDIVVDSIETIGPEAEQTAAGWDAWYTRVIQNLKPGVTELVVHVAYDDAEMRAATFDHPNWGSAWRQRELDFLTSDRFRKLLRDGNVKLVTWREIGKLIAK